MANLCIITPELPARGQDTDVAQHSEQLAKLCAAGQAHRVTLLYTGPCEPAELATLRHSYAQQGIALVGLSQCPRPVYPRPWIMLEHACSEALYAYCAQQAFDVILFPDLIGMGYVSIQAKRLGKAFAQTTLAVMLHRPTRWLRACSGVQPINPLDAIKLDHMEAYCLQHADVAVSPNQYMFDWARRADLSLSAQHPVLPYLAQPHWSEGPLPPRAPPHPEHLIYFGALEARKGLHALVASLLELGEELDAAGIKKLTFLSQQSLTERLQADSKLNRQLQTLKARGVELCEQPYRTLEEALQFLRDTGGIAVLPSVVDSSPYQLLASVACGLPLLTGNSPGSAELVQGSAAFTVPSAEEFRAALVQRVQRCQDAQPQHTYADVRRAWLTSVEVWAAGAKQAPAEIKVSTAAAWPSIAVCVPYHHGEDFIDATLQSIVATGYPNYEVIVVDDGSTRPASLQKIEALRAQYAERGWKFLRQDNAGCGPARNTAAQHTQADLLMFFDADDLAAPSMLHDFARGMQQAAVDCLTCYYAAFSSDRRAMGDMTLGYGYVPMGACWQAGLCENVFGGANFCVRREVFLELGGFTETRGGCEDWEFLAKLTLRGYALDVVPDTLFFYRRSVGSMTTTMDPMVSYERAVAPFRHARPEQWKKLLRNYLIPVNDNLKHLQGVNAQLTKMVKQQSSRCAHYEGEMQHMRAEVVRLRRDLLGRSAAPASAPA
jgi:GT2 family glycosyltransferase